MNLAKGEARRCEEICSRVYKFDNGTKTYLPSTELSRSIASQTLRSRSKYSPPSTCVYGPKAKNVDVRISLMWLCGGVCRSQSGE